MAFSLTGLLEVGLLVLVVGQCTVPTQTDCDLLTETNKVRTTNGLPELVMDERLWKAACLHALDMYNQDYFAHTSLDGRSPWTRIKNQGYCCGGGENLAYYYPTPVAAVQGWVNSAPHLANIKGGNFVHSGMAGVGRKWVQVFAGSSSSVGAPFVEVCKGGQAGGQSTSTYPSPFPTPYPSPFPTTHPSPFPTPHHSPFPTPAATTDTPASPGSLPLPSPTVEPSLSPTSNILPGAPGGAAAAGDEKGTTDILGGDKNPAAGVVFCLGLVGAVGLAAYHRKGANAQLDQQRRRPNPPATSIEVKV